MNIVVEALQGGLADYSGSAAAMLRIDKST